MGQRRKQLEQCRIMAVEIAKLNLQDGDTIVVKFPEDAIAANMETIIGRIDAMIQGMGKKVVGLILQGDVEIKIIRQGSDK